MPRMAGFRPRFVAALIAVSLLPVGAAAWAFGRPSAGNELERADLRLATALGLGGTAFAGELGRAEVKAARLAASPVVQRALVADDRPALERVAERESVVIERRGVVVAGTLEGPAVGRGVAIVAGGRGLGRVTAPVTIDRALAQRLTRAAADPDVVVVVTGARGRVVASPSGAHGILALSRGRPGDGRIGRDEYRALVGSPLPAARPYRFATAMERATIDSALDRRRTRVLLAALATLITVGIVGYALAPAFARGRVARKGLDLVGDALAATHDAHALLPVILESAVEATGARGGRLVDRGRELARAGDVESEAAPLTFSLGTDGSDGAELVLYPPAEGFSHDERELAAWLAAQGAIALENARLHAVVKEQAVTDPLTDLANRRRFMETLALELQRAERFSSPLALVLADLDNFKSVNDTYGHQAGDAVLHAFADVLRRRLRDIDLPARIGGEEFAILLPETDLAGGERLAERLRRSLAGRRLPAGQERSVAVTSSFGVAAYPQAATAAELLAAADAALYAAKLRGKNRVVARSGNTA